ncbi:SURF1 family protein [Hydrogenophaga pseudoflava]|uniref:SURF1 family protein n=1 Tax=Hydrogenophaga pseudoflava TaxID=47421 RepID=UPI0027E3BCC0|nr:SURF1 family protein [Hydrogenophaga pseudoflava]MDQ7744875.1 SURF1 family protein [Hydrogenophaga pseudoflava]
MSPRTRFWTVTIAAAGTVALTASLGIWQLSRAGQKQALETGIAERGGMAALDAAAMVSANGAWEPLLHRMVRLRGQWVPQASVFLDNRPMAGRSGFILVTPLRLSNNGPALLVQRGWVPRNFQDRVQVPDVATPAGEVEVAGRLAPPPSRLFELGAAEQGRIRQNLDIESLARDTGLDLLPVSVLQTGASPEGLLREWPRFESAAHKHHAYAAQWFAMSAVTAGLYAWFQLISPRRRRTLHGQDHR